MIYIRSLLLISISILTSSFYKIENYSLETGFYYLSETEAAGVLIKDINEETTYAIKKEPIIDIKDFTKIKFSNRDFKPTPQKVIEIKLSKEGRRRWRAAEERISKTGESIMFICNDKVYLEKKILGRCPIGDTSVELFFQKKYLDYVFEQIKQKIGQTE